MEKKYEDMINSILSHIGGEENVRDLRHCVTRLRFLLKDKKKANIEKLKTTKGVLGVVDAGGQFQVIVGPAVPSIYKELISMTNIQGVGEIKDDSPKEKQNLFNTAVETISSIMLPIVGLLAAAGMMMGITALLVGLNLIESNGSTHRILQVTSEAVLAFLPIFLGYTAMKKFGGTPMIGMAIGASLTHPHVVNHLLSMENPTFFGIPVFIPNNGYLNQVFPVIIAAYFATKLERFFTNIAPNSVRSFFIPMMTLLIIVPLTFLTIGPVIYFISNAIADSVLIIWRFSPMIWGALVGLLWLFLVMFGLHWTILPIAIAYVIQHGYGPILIGVVGTAHGLAGAILAVWIKTKSRSLREKCLPAFLATTIAGTTEPGIYSVTLPLKRPFLAHSLAAMVAGGIAGAMGMVSYMPVPGGIFLFTGYISPDGIGNSFFAALIAAPVSFIVGFGLTWLFGWKDPVDFEVKQ